MPKQGAHYLQAWLQQAGIKKIFSIPGAQTLSLWDAIGQNRDINLIIPQSEEKATWMAAGYGLVAQRPAVLMNTVGPGCANEMAALWGGALYRAPLLCITPTQPQIKQNQIKRVFQGLNQTLLPGQISLTTKPVTEIRQMQSILNEALHLTIRKKRPVRVPIHFPLFFAQLTPDHARQSKIQTNQTAEPALDSNLKLLQPFGKTQDHSTGLWISPASRKDSQFKRVRSLGLVSSSLFLHKDIPDIRHAIALALGTCMHTDQRTFLELPDLASLRDAMETLLWARHQAIPIHVLSSINHPEDTLIRRLCRRLQLQYRLAASNGWIEAIQNYKNYKGLILLFHP